MPGFNQRGPMNQGPMTGRGQGDCAEDLKAGSQNATFNYRGNDRGRGMGRQRRQGYHRGMGYCRMRPDSSIPTSEETLKLRVQTLETQLDAIKNEFAKFSNA